MRDELDGLLTQISDLKFEDFEYMGYFNRHSANKKELSPIFIHINGLKISIDVPLNIERNILKGKDCKVTDVYFFINHNNSLYLSSSNFFCDLLYEKQYIEAIDKHCYPIIKEWCLKNGYDVDSVLFEHNCYYYNVTKNGERYFPIYIYTFFEHDANTSNEKITDADITMAKDEYYTNLGSKKAFDIIESVKNIDKNVASMRYYQSRLENLLIKYN